jgi:tRNA nucleotidyltransferase (CCA-adding enzyme)
MSQIEIPAFCAEILKRLEKAGFEAWLVGGCLRDSLLSRPCHDWDIATCAAPCKVTEIFEKTVPTGIRYGTVTVFCGSGKAEVTTFRSECAYDDFRRPSSVNFEGSIAADLSRRDFTVNAMAFYPDRGLFDPFDGRSDLNAGLIRAVGEPAERFKEDALRILRAFRFCAQLGFTLEKQTLDAAVNTAGLVEKVSGERIKSEIDRILMSENPLQVFDLVNSNALDFLKFIPPSDSFALEKTPFVPAARWAAFFYLCVPESAQTAVFEKLHFDRETRGYTEWLIKELKRQPPCQGVEIKKSLSSGVSPERYAVYLRLYHALLGSDTEPQLSALAGILKNNEPYCARMLAVNGGDLVRAGIGQGQECGRILGLLLERVIENPSLNNKTALLELVNNLKGYH